MTDEISYSPSQKAVAALVAIGKPKASQLLKFFTREEVGKLLKVSKSMSTVTQESLGIIVGEFESDFALGAGLLDSSVQMNSILEGNFFDEQSGFHDEAVESDRSISSLQSAWDTLEIADEIQIAAYLSTEHPQVGAYVLSNVTPEKSAKVLQSLEQSARTPILKRMMEISEVSAEMRTLLEGEIVEKFGRSNTSNANESLSRLAMVINEFDGDTGEDILLDLSKAADPADISKIRSQLFRFEDVANLELSARATVFDSIPSEILTLSLHDALPDVIEAVLSSISQRTRRMIESDLKSNVQIRSTDISAARKQIVAEVLKLAKAGRFDLPNREPVSAK